MLTKKERIHKIVKRVRLHFRGSVITPAYPGFVLGCQRSGTNMMMDILERSPDVECYNENDEEAFENYMLRDLSLVPQLTARSAAKAVFFKCILQSQHARTLLRVNPNGRIVWMYRRYEDVINSNLKSFKGHRSEIELMLSDPVRAGWRVENVTAEDMAMVRRFYEKGISDASARAIMWLLRNRQLFQQELDTDARVLVANYDSVVKRPYACIGAVCRFFDLQFDPQFIREVNPNSVRKNPAPDIDPELREMCEEMWQKLTAASRL